MGEEFPFDVVACMAAFRLQLDFHPGVVALERVFGRGSAVATAERRNLAVGWHLAQWDQRLRLHRPAPPPVPVPAPVPASVPAPVPPPMPSQPLAPAPLPLFRPLSPPPPKPSEGSRSPPPTAPIYSSAAPCYSPTRHGPRPSASVTQVGKARVSVDPRLRRRRLSASSIGAGAKDAPPPPPPPQASFMRPSPPPIDPHQTLAMLPPSLPPMPTLPVKSCLKRPQSGAVPPPTTPNPQAALGFWDPHQGFASAASSPSKKRRRLVARKSIAPAKGPVPSSPFEEAVRASGSELWGGEGAVSAAPPLDRDLAKTPPQGPTPSGQATGPSAGPTAGPTTGPSAGPTPNPLQPSSASVSAGTVLISPPKQPPREHHNRYSGNGHLTANPQKVHLKYPATRVGRYRTKR